MATSELQRGRGRPRVYPAGTSAGDRKSLARRRDTRAGAHRLDVGLGPIAWKALQKLARKGERSPLIEKLILAELRRRATEAQ